MARCRRTFPGFAVVRKAFIGRSYDVVGIGQDRPEAWLDAIWTTGQDKLDTKEFIARNPDLKMVKADITVTFEKSEA
jgi:hypothetical protein